MLLSTHGNPNPKNFGSDSTPFPATVCSSPHRQYNVCSLTGYVLRVVGARIFLSGEKWLEFRIKGQAFRQLGRCKSWESTVVQRTVTFDQVVGQIA